MRKWTLAAAMWASAFTTGSLSAQPLLWNGTLTQAQVVTRAQQAFDAQLAQLNTETAAAQAQSLRAQALPQISVSETAMNSTLVQLGMPSARQTYMSFNGTLPIFAPQAWAAARAAGSDAAAARANAAMAINQAVTDAVQRYDAAALAAAIVVQRGVDVEDQQSHLRFTLEQVRVGRTARYLIARDEAALARAEQSQEDAKADAARALHALEVPLDIDVASQPAVALGMPSLTFTPDIASLQERAYVQRPDVVAATRTLSAGRERLSRSRSEYLPTVSATAQTYSGVSSPPLGHVGSQVGIVASLPIFDAGSRSADVRIANADYQRDSIALDRARLQAQADVLDAVRDLQAAQRNVSTANAELRNAKEELHVAQLRERSGKGIELETLDALAALAGAREDVLHAAARYQDSLAALHRAVGDYAPTPF